ncbi:TonB family C-terminal domain [Serratia entomophila]|nr:TonB family C-terminal domain [Serratia entomophila]CAI0830208.1 TonB family C-terminal domain [Serratia entomophila]CAI0834191.1 TonB family C-terminal domain [Serratia entomophila]CAI0834977.1 TonB family C-terminal domain [Serratia entomophila]CAI0837763.1 TonB family C-terminal domain [Serratia entomophila]
MLFHSKQSNEPAAYAVSGKKSPMFYLRLLLALALAAGIGVIIWQWAQDMSGVRREAPKVPMIIPLPPPPPPPPEPPKQPEPEPEKVAEPEPPPEPKPTEQPKPQEEAPKPADDMAKAMEMDGSAQAGGDAFNIGAGSGSGMSGSGGGGGLGNATYGQYLSHIFQKILREDESTRLLSFRLQLNLWLNEAGQVTRVDIVKSSGEKDIDNKVVAALRSAPAMSQKPPKSLSLPVRILLQGRRPG